MDSIRRDTLNLNSEQQYLRHSIELILLGRDHRYITNDEITKEFVSEAVTFFKKVVEAKLDSKSICMNWYKEAFIFNESDKNLLAAYGGLSVKTINNKRKSTKYEVVLEESLNNFELLLSTVNKLCDSDIEIDLSISFNGVAVSLNLSESLIVMNVLAMRRNQIRGGKWSSLGKNVEAPLLKTMCLLFQVPMNNYSEGNRTDLREVDFHLITRNGEQKKCEVKLMGKGNPEGADSLYARGANVFVASSLSETNIKQLNNEGVMWVELGKPRGFLKFGEVLENLDIPHKKLSATDEEIPNLINRALNRLV